MNGLRNISLAKRIYLLSGTVVLLFLLVIGWLLLQLRGNLYEARRHEIRNIVESGWHILEFHAQQVDSGNFSPQEARQRALQVIRSQRFDAGNYFWLSDLKGTMIMHPLESELEGQDLIHYLDPSGKPLFKEMVEVVGKNGEGFVKYLWSRPDGSEPEAKVSFVKEFPAWEWIIGAGYYVGDIDREVIRITVLVHTVIAAVIIGALLLVTYMARSISVPLARAVVMIEALERGFLGHRLRLDQRDEIGRLGKAMDAFADNLQHEILSAFDHLARGDFSFEAKGLIQVPLARTNVQLNDLVAKLDSTVVEALEARTKTEALIAAIGEGVAIFNPELKFIYQNPIHKELAGDHLGDPCFHAYEHIEHACAKCAVKQSLTDGTIHRMERLIRFGSRETHIEVTTSPVRDATGSILAIIEIARDVTARKQAEAALAESEARYFSLFWHNHAVMLLIDPEEGAIIDANPSACTFYGYEREQLLRMKITEINTLSPADVEHEIKTARKERRGHFDFRHRLATGEVRDVEVFSGPVKVKGKDMLYSIVHDVTERRQAEAHVKYLAFHDQLTGLANRALLEDRLTQALAHALRNNDTGALFFIDLDRFKVINDSLGHHAGDLLLKQVGNRLKAMVRETDTVCRSGGDEFILLFPEIGGPTDAAHLAEKVLAAFTVPFIVEGREIVTSPSIGISLYPADGADFPTLSRNADAAMYLAKDQGRNNFQFFKPELTNAAQERLALENELRKALAGNDLQLHYQPQFDTATGEIIGVEALVRWHHPRRGWISPAQFIPIAEQSGLIETLGAWVLRTACAQNMQWQRRGYSPIRMAVNVSGRQFQQKGFIDIVDRVLGETGLDPCWLELEVTENIVMENVGQTIMTLTALKARSISLAIDDFGTGYSSLSYLRQFPIDRLKIDRSFVTEVTTNADDAAIASAVISLARTLNLEVVAEGVETAEQAQFLSERQCDIMQGYYFGRPSPPDEISRFLKSGRPASACA
jgi:diguanylate cyclase (GGDEF)-like protein/PAS domain S-box-containing protein